ncbi:MULTISPECIES: LuxR C-terminal-related transcriptional regulator [Shewanella]|nr:hypothetical protein [Shewanella algae]NJI86863.1 hypothetical protein [Shewanella sp. Iso12]MBO2690115.1 hypothetical protein [Shewanella algae]PWF90288.1 hypothetical protein DD549_19530 [Shewanella algae]QHD55699.1 hypothetical protein GM320_08440 [Shewanella algae]
MAKLKISPNTVKMHLLHIYQKITLNN